MFEPYLEEIGACPGRDDVFCVMPNCPVTSRTHGDEALAWERWGELSETDTGAHPLNIALSRAYLPYFDSLGLRAQYDTEHLKKGDPLTGKDLEEYLFSFVKSSALRFFDSLYDEGGREAVDAYLRSDLPGSPMYHTAASKRDWIEPVYGENGRVTDIGGSWREFWRYAAGEKDFDSSVPIAGQYDRAYLAPDSCQEGNGVINTGAGIGWDAEFCQPSNPSFGRPEDYAAAYTSFGQEYLEKRGITVSGGYRELIGLQRNSIDPLYFLSMAESERRIAPHWFMRTGAVDLVTPHPIFFSIVTKLQNMGIDVDAALVWDQYHSLTTDTESFFQFAEQILR